jgi:hypothetical protein
MITPTTPISDLERPSGLQYFYDSMLGHYSKGRNDLCWTHWRRSAQGRRFLVCGRSTDPTDEQIELWNLIHDQLDELVNKSVKTIQCLSINQLDCDEEVSLEEKLESLKHFKQEDFYLIEVRIETQKRFELFFTSEATDISNLIPMVTFEAFVLVSSRWVI